MATKTYEKRDLYAEVTNTIIEALETAGEWRRPWTDLGLDAGAPRSVDGRPYRGANVLLLWIAALKQDYGTGIWATYNAWKKHGAQVRRGEKGTTVTLWKPIKRKARDGEQGDEDGKRDALLLRNYTVFNAEQVDGWTPPELPPGPDPLVHAEEFFAAIGADVTYGGDSAHYTPALDKIAMPVIESFDSADAFYGTQAHEHAHWTGHQSRLDRKLDQARFGNDAYAFEELVAELSSAFTLAHLGIVNPAVRENHASYVRNWLSILRDDRKAIFTAASQAQKATDLLLALAEPQAEPDSDDEEVAA